ncbi:ubiquitin carboxyl-terminal hydrolase [Colletotrichum abscissum]|uniref:ubiquitinyl hydrolase 1 n=1 Tax=Colletotrichum abscissum TaxID=1671311 RepID=A0A9P9X9W1_9PEZI|nr:ubiquitin carboxyl-terminal hydrolase [Colletotrichum abscissum]KAI3544133.1 ubiquitin carboxyl-terminal hydrolase [Colletotrichum abscissum]KAK1525163.1 ubiquitin carboxyl-terminal hydrolase [Colletotrichum abscissum]
MSNDIHHFLLERASKPQSHSGCLGKSFVQSSVSPAATPELHRQLTFTTSSSKKRKISRNQTRTDDTSNPSSPDTVLPSCEPNDDPAFSFSAAHSTDGLSTPTYLRGDSYPASSLPARLQTGSHVSAEYASSTAASSPCGVADLSIDSDRGGDISGTETGTALTSHSARSRSPFNVSRRAIMTSDANPHQRSSSPLKRRASSMDPDADVSMKEEDVEMASTNQQQQQQSAEDAESAPTSSNTHLPRAMSIDLPDNVAKGASKKSNDKDLPPLEDQIKTIQTLLKAFNDEPPKIGDVAYVVSRSWVEKALALGGDPKFAKKETTDKPLGPVDNSDLILEVLSQPSGDDFVRMKPGTGMEECELFPEDAWTLVSEWYGVGEGQKPIVRSAINAAPDSTSEKNVMFELNPPVFTIHRLWSMASPFKIKDELKSKEPLVLARSATTPYHPFYKELKELTGVPLDRKMRVWQLTQQPEAQESSPRSALTPPDSPNPDKDGESSSGPWQRMLVEVPSFTKVNGGDRQVVSAVDHTTNPNYNGNSPLSVHGLMQDMTLVIDEEIAKNAWVSTYFKNGKNDKVLASRGSATSLKATSSGRSSPAPQGPVTRGRTQQKKKPGRGLGAVGLQNLGNTCYMNSALQCVRSVEELTKYFLTDKYKEELNKGNPLGYKGQVAMAYGGLLKEIYNESRGAVSPRDFKNTVGRARATFQGWGQQDTQEFLGFLLDALQEDLSRIHKKPYIEKPDSTDDMIGDEEAIRKMAEEVWDITRKRDDSVIADLFTGLYKSTLKCPTCDKISITFDPFNNLTLPLPMEDMWSRPVKFYPLNDVPVKFEVELPKHSAIELLKKALSDKTGVPVELLMGAEEFKGKFFKVYSDATSVSEEIQSNDIPAFHELESSPTNYPPKQKKMGTPRSMLEISDEPWVDPRTERLLVPVLHRKKTGNTYRLRGDDIAAPPHFIVVTPEESRNEDAIRRKVLEKVATFSTWSEFEETDESTEADMVITSQSDADSSGDSKVVSNSVEGEDDLVNVSVGAGEQQQTRRPTLKQFNVRRPKWASPKEYLPPHLQNLFELSFFGESNDYGLPVGWNTVDDNKNFRLLSSRAPELPNEDSNSPGSTNGADSEHESVSEETTPQSVEEQTRMADESEEDEPVRVIKPMNRGRGNHKVGGARRKNNKGNKTYGKRGGKRRNRDSRNSKEQSFHVVDVEPQPSPEDDIRGGPLVRLDEGIVVDWSEETWDLVFGKESLRDTDDNRGSKTFTEPEELKDPILEQKRKSRMARKKQGITLEECLDEFEKAEVLSEQDMWYCPRCKEHRRASKKFDLWKTPDILVVHLKRFSSAGWRRDKLDVLVDFPIEGLDLHKRVLCQETGKEEIYDLIAVDDHFGGLGGGHYTAYGRNFVDGQWYNYNDTSASKTSPESVVTRAAYLLFYRRRSEGPLGGPRFKEIFDKFDKDGEDDDEEDTDSGEDQRLVGGSSLTGSSRLGIGAEATHPRGNRGLASNTMSTANLGAEDDLPPYEGSSSTNVGSENIQNSIEDEGIGMTDYNGDSTAFSATQGWNWNSLGSADGTNNSLGLDGYGSDDAQPDSSDEREVGNDTDMQFDETMGDYETAHDEAPPPPDFGAQVGLSEIQTAAWARQNNAEVISVPAADNDTASTEAAEIHLDDDAEAHGQTTRSR